MNSITKERIELFIKNPLDNGLTRGEQMEVARIALASLEAEPVAWKATFTQIDHEYNTFTAMYSDKAEAERWVRLHQVGDFRAEITPLYAAPPALVVPDEMDLLTCHLDGVTETYADGWNACRAAMLQGIQPVSQTYNLPELIEGMEVSIDVSTCDADLGNRYFGTVTEALELDTAKNGYILLVQDAEPNFDVNGNSPVTPDGWVIVPKELTPEMMRAVQIRSELGGYATSNLSGAYNMFSEFWNVAVSAAPKVDDL